MTTIILSTLLLLPCAAKAGTQVQWQDVAPPAVQGVLISSINFTSVSVATFTLLGSGSFSVLQTSTTYDVACNVIAVAGSSFPTLILGDGTKLDFAQHYADGGQAGYGAAATNFGDRSSGVNEWFQWQLKNDNTSQAAGNSVLARFHFESVLGSTNTLRGFMDSDGDDSATSFGLRTIGHVAYKNPSGNVRSIAFAGCAAALGSSCSANKTYSGHCEIYQGVTHP